MHFTPVRMADKCTHHHPSSCYYCWLPSAVLVCCLSRTDTSWQRLSPKMMIFMPLLTRWWSSVVDLCFGSLLLVLWESGRSSSYVFLQHSFPHFICFLLLITVNPSSSSLFCAATAPSSFKYPPEVIVNFLFLLRYLSYFGRNSHYWG